METRQPRSPAGGTPGFDDEPQLAMTKVPSDPAQVVVNHASFRVRLATPVVGRARSYGARAGLGEGASETTRLGAVPAARRRRAPVVWSGRTEQGGEAATQLLQAVRSAGHGDADDVGATQVLPRIQLDEAPPPTVVGPRSPQPDSPYTGGMPPRHTGFADGPSGDDGYDSGYAGGYGSGYDDPPPTTPGPERAGAADQRGRRPADSMRHAYYPGRRMNLGVVLLPLRVFLGLISIYAGMGKLSDPVYFDGGERGSMVTWMRSLHPWPVAEPLRDFALGHPVGAGLTIAFLQVVVGVLTVMGLWQRIAASFGAVLSAALLVTVSWRTVPAYDAPDIIYLAAWSPLIIAGAPVYSMDSRLAGDAWRRLGPRVELWQLRRRVLRRGAMMAAVVAGLSLLFGSMIGGAVRSSETVRMPGPDDAPRNNLPGSPLPGKSSGAHHRGAHGPGAAADSPSAHRRSPHPSSSATPSSPGAARESGSVGGYGRPSQSQGGADTVPRAPVRQAPVASAGPSSNGGASGGSSTGGGAGPSSGDRQSGGSSSGALGGLLG